MEDSPQDRTEDRRRRGPLGDDEDALTRQGSPEDAEETTIRTPASETTSPRVPGEEDPETRVIRTSGARADETPYPDAYSEAPELREARLREAYGGVDWLASFIGSVFALVCAGILLSFSGLVLGLLGFAPNLESPTIDAAITADLVVIGIVLFLAYFFGGYVAGRLARFDGGRNGAATVLWGILLSFILALFGSFLPGPLSGPLQEFAKNGVQPAISGLTAAGIVGLGIVVGALLLELLGGFLGGRLGNSYHTNIDEMI